ncbi:ADP-ribosylglycohydrolase family protein [Paraburkholderia acidicola]|uniref:ADP-ribosylglycohydrolase family protein n=1 Tax=Paraburkholderia acidicola TaxID=1912599 RepID=A0ABV1LMG3_9BURK
MSTNDSRLSAEQKEMVKRSIERFTRKNQYPADMGFLPYSRKFTDAPVELKTAWLAEYFQYRRQHPSAGSSELLSVLGQLHADNSDLANRFRGSLLGLAIGDALGTTLEFAARDSATVTDIVGGGPFHLKAGYWTDDTSMACCLAYSLIKCGGYDAKDAMQAFSYWYRFGAYSPTGACFDIGGTTRDAIDRYLETGDAIAGSTNPGAAGNGSLMRLVPVVLFYSDNFEKAVSFAAESSRLTHGATEAVDACRFFAGLLWGALAGQPKETLLSDRYAPIRSYWEHNPLSPAVERIARGSYKYKARSEISSSGYVIDTLEAALWAFHNNEGFEPGLLAAVNLAGDADTVGAVFGQLAGAHYGETQLPIKWILKTHASHGFYHFAHDLLAIKG